MVRRFCSQSSYLGKILFAHASKIIRNWFLTLQPDILYIICNLPKWEPDRVWIKYERLTLYISLWTNFSTYLFMQLCERKKSFIKILTLILYLKLYH